MASWTGQSLPTRYVSSWALVSLWVKWQRSTVGRETWVQRFMKQVSEPAGVRQHGLMSRCRTWHTGGHIVSYPPRWVTCENERGAAAAAVTSVVSDSVRPHRRQPTRLPRPWDSPGKNTGVGCHFLHQCMKVKSESEVTQSCPTLCDPMDCSLPGSSIHGIFQARVLEWGAIAFSRAGATL